MKLGVQRSLRRIFPTKSGVSRSDNCFNGGNIAIRNLLFSQQVA